MNSKPLPQVITIDYWWYKTKSTQGRYRVLMATGLVLCCLFVFSLLAIKLLLEFLGFLAELASTVAKHIPSDSSEESDDPSAEDVYAQYYRDKESFGHDYASKFHGLDG